MVQQTPDQAARRAGNNMQRNLPYDNWMNTLGLPIYRGHFVANPKTLELGEWKDRGVNAAFIQLMGMQGVCEARITEIPPGATSEPMKQAVSEVVYVLDGQGLTTVWAGDGPKKTFEWQKSSLFILPRNTWHQFSNARGDRPARVLNYNHRPLAMSAVPDLDFHFKGPLEEPELLYPKEGDDFYAEAKMVTREVEGGRRGQGVSWHAHFIPDMSAWDKLVPFWGRGAGGYRVGIQFPGVDMNCHMSVFDPQLYKKAHKHGPGRVIVIPKGEGYSVLTPPPGVDGERAVCPWEEGSIFVPPDNWYHQHFNTGTGEARYLALHALPQFSGNPYRHQIEYPFEDPWVRERFESEIAKKGLKTLMPKEAYEDPTFEWDYGDDD
jgi:oxalate decarboxylase/phosphoglucose isomerase-like protein (cupin superfamily)